MDGGYEEQLVFCLCCSHLKEYWSIIGCMENIKTVGVILFGIVAVALLLLMFVGVAVLGVIALGSAALGAYVAYGNSVVYGIEIIPEMPRVCSILLGLAFIALGTLTAVAVEASRLHATQAVRAYARWHRNALRKGGAAALPPLPLQPWVTPLKRRVMRSVARVSCVVFCLALVATMGSMIATSRSLEPWHVWGWFE